MTTSDRRKAERRELRFESLDDVMAEVERLGATGEPRSTGNWSPGQNLQHIAKLMALSIDGFGDLKAPLSIRLGARMMKQRFLAKSMPVGVNLPANMSLLMPDDDVSWDKGVAELRQAIERLKSERAEAESPVLGPLTHDEWINLHLRHAEMHLGFLHPA